jgi:hypothetical protein
MDDFNFQSIICIEFDRMWLGAIHDLTYSIYTQIPPIVFVSNSIHLMRRGYITLKENL